MSCRGSCRVCWAYRFLVYIRNIHEIKASITVGDCLLLNCCLIFAVSCPLLHCSANQPHHLLLVLGVFLTISPYYCYYYFYCFYYYLVSSFFFNKSNKLPLSIFIELLPRFCCTHEHMKNEQGLAVPVPWIFPCGAWNNARLI